MVAFNLCNFIRLEVMDMALDNILIAIIHMLVSTIIVQVTIIVILCVALIFATNPKQDKIKTHL